MIKSDLHYGACRWLTKKKPSLKRVFFMDNFYMRHGLTTLLNAITNGKSKIIGIVRMNVIDGTKKKCVLKATELLQDQPHGT